MRKKGNKNSELFLNYTKIHTQNFWISNSKWFAKTTLITKKCFGEKLTVILDVIFKTTIDQTIPRELKKANKAAEQNNLVPTHQ